MNYPIVSAENGEEKVIAVYNFGQYVKVACEPGKTCYVVNATGRSELIVELQSEPVYAELLDTMGRAVQAPVLKTGFARLPVPASGLMILKF